MSIFTETKMGRPHVSPSFPQQTRVEARVLAPEEELGITEPCLKAPRGVRCDPYDKSKRCGFGCGMMSGDAKVWGGRNA